jgi:hypothetical protein
MSGIGILDKIILRIRMVINYVKIITSYFLNKDQVDPGKNIAFFDLNDRRPGRYYYTLMVFFKECGYQVVLKHNFWFIANCLTFDALIFKIKGIRIQFAAPNHPSALYIFDKKAPKEATPRASRSVGLDFDIYSPKKNFPAFLTLPYVMHPLMYHLQKHKQLKSLRTQARKFRASFSGNTENQAYSAPIIKDFFKKINRFEVIKTLKENLREKEFVIIDAAGQIQQHSGKFLNKFIFFEWFNTPVKNNASARISEDNWLEFLGQSDFFLACPGISMPLSHNIIEAMAVGTIPITQYPELFDPPLVAMKNCIYYNSREDLVDQIRLVLNMDADQISSLRVQAAQYYDDHLSPESFCKKLAQMNENKFILFMNTENSSLQDHFGKLEI